MRSIQIDFFSYIWTLVAIFDAVTYYKPQLGFDINIELCTGEKGKDNKKGLWNSP